MAEIYHRYIFLQGGSFFDTGGSPNIKGVGFSYNKILKMGIGCAEHSVEISRILFLHFGGYHSGGSLLSTHNIVSPRSIQFNYRVNTI